MAGGIETSWIEDIGCELWVGSWRASSLEATRILSVAACLVFSTWREG